MPFIAQILVLGLISLSLNLYDADKTTAYQKKHTDFSKTKTFYYQATPERKKALLIHGITGSPHELRWLAEYLQQRGISSNCPRLYGHGTNAFDLEKYKMEDWHKQIFEEANNNNYDYIIGFCGGANLAVDLAVEKEYEKIVLISPIFKYRALFLGQNFSFMLPVLNPFYRFYKKAEYYRKYEDRIDYMLMPLATVRDLDRYNRKTLKKLNKINEKTLVLFGGKDELYAKGLPDLLQKKISDVRVITIKDGKHVLPKIKNRQEVFQIIGDFLLEEVEK